MARFNVGVHIRPQHTTVEAMRAGWKAADELGVDLITTWDHFFPLGGDASGSHFECWTLLAAIACDTKHARFGSMVTSNGYRNPDLIADMARTVDHISGGRFNLGIGAGWAERDYREYGFEFESGPERLKALERSLPRIKNRLAKLNPPPKGPLPILIGGGGEKVTLRLAAQFADMWNTIATPENYSRKNRILDDWCAKVGRNPREIERTVNIPVTAIPSADHYLEAGAQTLLLQLDHPFDLRPAEQLLKISGR
ncbi:MAG: LLM class F420-dependent oxidoreductase [Chloroflexota bacterium]|nr:LLM class F420-dependent oxidoreductase [Chloroflexota bacterium]